MTSPDRLDDLIERQPLDPLAIRNWLQHRQGEINEAFLQGAPVRRQIRARSDLIDRLLQQLWRQQITHCGHSALVAVGGYGRQELHPGSDIDLLFLLEEQEKEVCCTEIGTLITLLWDLGLKIGHSVRSVEQCLEEGEQEITITTNLLESRLLCGSTQTFDRLQHLLNRDSHWASGPFFIAKRNEQQARHAKYNDTAYNLEPNIKEGPGGLRDIQNILWVTRRHFGSSQLKELVDHHFLTTAECADLEAGQERLWEIRYALHLIAGRGEDRLLFDHQPELARHFGHLDNEVHQGVESFMHSYFRIIRGLSLLNEMLLQLFEEELLTPREQRIPTPLDDQLGVRANYLTLLHHDSIRRDPDLALTLFFTLLKRPELKGFTAETIRHLRSSRQQIADHVRCHPLTRRRFLQLFYRGEGLTHTLRRMSRYGLLGAFLPEFEKVVGLMQHDLFHAYTVDEHTLFVVRNLRRFTVPEFRQEFPLQSLLILQLQYPERLYLGALFHDIAKGRGGDHSKLGADVVRAFCRNHGLDYATTREIAWLVENHLIMSTFAQRHDIDDSDEIERFANMVENQTRLDMLYLLTVADIRATNSNLWNHFKEALLAKLYNHTTNALLSEHYSDLQINLDGRNRALPRLAAKGLPPEQIQTFWKGIGEEYFQRHDDQEIEWHTDLILTREQRPLIAFRKESHQGGSEILVYTRDRTFLFSILVHTLESLHLNIQAARINTTHNSYALDIFTVLDQNGETLQEPQLLERIEQSLLRELDHPTLIHQPVQFRRSRHQKHFHDRTTVSYRQDQKRQQTVLEINATDRPGLLSTLCQVFMQCDIRIYNAKITTLGEWVEDIFWVCHQDKRPLSDAEVEREITPRVLEALEQ